ncbi:MAG: potassium-transporting ATPase subunit KdpA [Nitrosomonadales bacterium SCN 54-20]|nr:MAG: potassium-transporting ATPase subunit KdpA [Nitrosomonadales bacterium SCN 54-20]
MEANILIQVGLYLLVLVTLARPTGLFIAGVMEGKVLRLSSVAGAIERVLYRAGRIDPVEEMDWKRYALALLLFNLIGLLATYAVQHLQFWLPLNPQSFKAPSPDSSFNTAVSFVTNTNWQGYSGETTMSYFTQMAALAVQNFLSAATGIAVAIALIRGFARHSTQTIGNFWVDLTRSTLYILLPLSLLLAVIFMSQGVIQNFDDYRKVQTVEAIPQQSPPYMQSGSLDNDDNNSSSEIARAQIQTLPMGPVASQEAIKLLGTNGGGFFNANSSHPYENPSPLTNFLSMLAIFLVPAALCHTFGAMIGDQRQGWAIFSAMAAIFIVMAGIGIWAEQNGNTLLGAAGADQSSSALQAGGNMEGKETRFGIAVSMLFAAVTTGASCGAVNAMHDSLTPLGGLVPLWLMQLGEIAFGGVGTGLYTMLIYAVMAVFVAGLMIGRTPEYLSKKIEVFDMKMTALVLLITPILVLAGTAIAVTLEAGRSGIANPGPHGFSEILYAFTSAANNNGSAFAGLSANTPFYNFALAVAMLLGRFGVIVPVLAIAGSLAAKKRIQPGLGTMPTHGALFVALLIGTVILVGALTYVPALAVGPVIEHLIMTGVR